MQNLKRNKRGVIADETIDLFIAAIILVALIYLGFVVYGWVTSNSQTEQARTTIVDLSSNVDNVLLGGEKKFVYLSPKDWFLVYYPNPLDKQGCYGEHYCLCLCENDDCGGKYACNKVGKDVSMPNYIELDNAPTNLILSSTDPDKITIREESK